MASRARAAADDPAGQLRALITETARQAYLDAAISLLSSPPGPG